MEGFKIDSIEFENYKAFKSLLLVVSGNNLAITGATGQGKTTVITALWELLKSVGEPITSGEAAGRLRITLISGDQRKIYAERRYTASAANITIVDEAGQKISISEFKAWFGSLAINPHKLADLKPGELVDTLTSCVVFPTGFDLVKLDAEIAQQAETRKNKKTIIKDLEKKLGTQPENIAPVDTAELLKSLEAEKVKKAQIDTTEETLETTTARLEAIDLEIITLQAEKKKLEAWKPGAQQWLKEATENVDGVQNQINNIAVTNQSAADYTAWYNKYTEIVVESKEVTAADLKLKDLRQQRKNGLETARWPLPGLSIENGQVFYKKLPFQQAGDSEKMLICGALAAEQIKNNKMRVVRMDRIESMSKPDFAQLTAIFNNYGVQVLSTRVSRAGEVEPGELVIHDGGQL